MLSIKKFNSHKCKLTLTDVKRIPVVYFQDDSYNDKKLMSGWGIDGIIYTFEVVPRKAIPVVMPLSDESKQHKQSDGEVTEPLRLLYVKNGLMQNRLFVLNNKNFSALYRTPIIEERGNLNYR